MDVMFVHVGLGTLFAALVFAHCLADFPLQSDFLARGKNRHQPIPGVPWWICLTAHAAIHAGFVGVCTGSPVLVAAEFCLHWMIDFAKCEGAFGTGERAFVEDQLLHILCKVLWVTLIAVGIR